jgi:hypothetical protein
VNWTRAWTRRRLLATVVGQDLTKARLGASASPARSPATGVISTVDPQTRHGHKTNARSFDGYKAHLAADPDSEIITATQVTPDTSVWHPWPPRFTHSVSLVAIHRNGHADG